ncbi:MAG: hypothetical protein RIQ93_465 [Verrucomicrobiota bacterium]|jgi:hypothetical protein
MKTFRILTAFVLAGGAFSQGQPSAAPSVEFIGAAPRSAEELDQLLGPIALYPDALIALILPAATAPADVVLAARYLRDANGLSQIESRAWDDSVKSLTHYPEVLQWMDQNITWTEQVGEAFRIQPNDMMNAVQRLRAKAQSVGSLINTPQQQVVAQAGVISIVPVQPEIIYVPHYDPQVVYISQPYYPASYLRFSAPYATGLWLSYGVDWDRRRVCYVPRPDRTRYWNDYRAHWSRPAPNFPRASFNYNQSYFRPWTPGSSPAFSYRSSPRSIPRPSNITPRAIYNSSPEPRTNHSPYGYTTENHSTYSGGRITPPRPPAAPANSRTFASTSAHTTILSAPSVPPLPPARPMPAPATVAPSSSRPATRTYRSGGGEYRTDHRSLDYRGPRFVPMNPPTPAYRGVPASPSAAPDAPPRQSTRSGSGWTRPANPPPANNVAAAPDAPAVAPAAPESSRPNPTAWGRGRPGR